MNEIKTPNITKTKKPIAQNTLPDFRTYNLVGLLGGSFDPPHLGHIEMSKTILEMLGLDVVWWLITKQNPLKQHKPQTLKQRLTDCKKLIDKNKLSPHILASSIDEHYQTHYSYKIAQALKNDYPHIVFIWLMGLDVFCKLEDWRHWQRFIKTMPLCVYPRTTKKLIDKIPSSLKQYQTTKEGILSHSPPCWCLIKAKEINLASRHLR